jgi:hypothetical protein
VRPLVPPRQTLSVTTMADFEASVAALTPAWTPPTSNVPAKLFDCAGPYAIKYVAPIGPSAAAAALSIAAESAEPAVVIAADADSLAAENSSMPEGTAAKTSPIGSIPSRLGAHDASKGDTQTIAAKVHSS